MERFNFRVNSTDSFRNQQNQKKNASSTSSLLRIQDQMRETSTKRFEQYNKDFNFNNENLEKILIAMGNYISSKMQQGKAVVIPKFGTFTFLPQNIDLEGTNNLEKNENQLRFPVFIVTKDFINGVNSAIINDSTQNRLRPLHKSLQTSGTPTAKINISEIATQCGLGNGFVKEGIQNILRQIINNVKNNSQDSLHIPSVGKLIINNQLAGIRFDSTITYPNRNIRKAPTYNQSPMMSPYQNYSDLKNSIRQYTEEYGNKRSGSILNLHDSQYKNINQKLTFTESTDDIKGPSFFYQRKNSIHSEKNQKNYDSIDILKKEKLNKDSIYPYMTYTYTNNSNANRVIGNDSHIKCLNTLNFNREKILNSFEQIPIDQMIQYDIVREKLKLLIDIDLDQIKRILFPNLIGYSKDHFITLKQLFQRIKHLLNAKKEVDVLSTFTHSFSGITLQTNDSSKISKNLKSKLSFLTDQQKTNGISKITLKQLAKTLIQKRNDIRKILQENKLTIDSNLTEQEILFYLRKIPEFTFSQEIFYSILKGLNLSVDDKNELDYQKTTINKLTFLQLFQRALQFLSQIKFKKDDVGQQALAQSLIRKLKDCMYLHNKNINEISKQFKSQNNKIGMEKFQQMIKEITTHTNYSFSQKEIETIFFYLYTKGFYSCSNVIEINKELPLINITTQLQPQEIVKEWESVGIKKMREWMIKKNLNSENAFEKLLYLQNKSSNARFLTLQEFRQTLQQEGLPLTLKQIDYLFKAIDINNDSIIDKEEWKLKVFDDFKNPLQFLREIIVSNNIGSEDLLHQMRLNIYDEPLNYQQFCKAIGFLNQQLNSLQIRVLFTEIKGENTGKVDISNLIETLCGEVVCDKAKIYNKIFEKINLLGEIKSKEIFEDLDIQNQGTLDPNLFKLALRKLQIQLPDFELDRFIRLIDKDKFKRIDYVWFLNHLQKRNNKNDIVVQMKNLIEKIQRYLKQNKQTPEQLINQINKYGEVDIGRIGIKLFANLITKKIDKNILEQQLIEIISKFDIDQDGFISIDDLNTVLKNRYHDNFIKQICGVQNGQELATQLKEEKFVEVIRQLKEQLANRGLQERQLFKILDTKGTGFINFTDFSTGIDQFIQLSQYIKEKVFEKLDSSKT